MVLSELLKEKLDCKFKRVRTYAGPLAQKKPQYFHNFCEGIGKGIVLGSPSIQFTTLDAGFGGAPPIPGVGKGIGIIMDVDWFTENLYKELRSRIMSGHGKTVHPEWCSGALTYSPIVGTWRKGDDENGVELKFNGHTYEIDGYGNDDSSGSGSYSWDSLTTSFNRCVSTSHGWDFPNGSVRIVVKPTYLQIFSDGNLYDTFDRVGPAPEPAPPGHCSLKPNQYNKYNFLTALCEGISESVAEHYEQFRDLDSTHPLVYAGIGLINKGMFMGVVESNVAAMIKQEGSMMQGSFWMQVCEAVAKIYTQAIHTKSTGEVTITGACSPSQHQACSLPMIGTGNGVAT
jgi:hypothetical protein